MAGITILQVVASVHAFLAGTCKMDDRTRRAAWLLAGLVGGALVGSWVLWSIRRSFFIEGLLWNGYSMAPTVPHGSHCIKDKVTYRYRDPEIGDIVVLTPPEIPGVKRKGRVTQLSRIVARGGETVQVRNGAIFVNGEYREPARNRLDSGSTISPREEAFYYGYIYAVAEPYRVPEGHYFVIGDNRISGVDSRSYGPVSKKDIIGRITRVYWRPWRRHLPPPPEIDQGEPPNREGGGDGSQLSEEQLRDLLNSLSKGKRGEGQARPSN
jgi:signal peptidase I